MKDMPFQPRLRIADIKDDAAREILLEAEQRGRAIIDKTIGKNSFGAIDTLVLGLASIIAEIRNHNENKTHSDHATTR